MMYHPRNWINTTIIIIIVWKHPIERKDKDDPEDEDDDESIFRIKKLI